MSNASNKVNTCSSWNYWSQVGQVISSMLMSFFSLEGLFCFRSYMSWRPTCISFGEVHYLNSQKLTYPTLGIGKSSKVPAGWGYVRSQEGSWAAIFQTTRLGKWPSLEHLHTVDGSEILHQLPVDRVILSHYLQGILHLRWLPRFLPSTVLVLGFVLDSVVSFGCPLESFWAPCLYQKLSFGLHRLRLSGSKVVKNSPSPDTWLQSGLKFEPQKKTPQKNKQTNKHTWHGGSKSQPFCWCRKNGPSDLAGFPWQGFWRTSSPERKPCRIWKGFQNEKFRMNYLFSIICINGNLV